MHFCIPQNRKYKSSYLLISIDDNVWQLIIIDIFLKKGINITDCKQIISYVISHNMKYVKNRVSSLHMRANLALCHYMNLHIDIYSNCSKLSLLIVLIMNLLIK